MAAPAIDFTKLPKYLTPFLKLYIQKYVHKNYKQWVLFIDRFMRYLELKNEMYDGIIVQKENSIYNNYNNFGKFSRVDDFPTENKDVLNAFVKEYASVLDFRNAYLSFDDAAMRELCKFANLVYGVKDTYKTYAFIFSILNQYYLRYGQFDIVFRAYYNQHSLDFSTVVPPRFYYQLEVDDATPFFYGIDIYGVASGSKGTVKIVDVDNKMLYLDDVPKAWAIPEPIKMNGIVVALTVSEPYPYKEYMAKNQIILCDQPVYELSSIGFNDIFIDRKTLTNADKAKVPFFYQIVSKSDILTVPEFNSKLKSVSHPAGFSCETIYVVDDLIPELLHTDSRTFLKRTFDVDSNT